MRAEVTDRYWRTTVRLEISSGQPSMAVVLVHTFKVDGDDVVVLPA